MVVLIWFDILADYDMWVATASLTNVWRFGFNLTSAAAMVNVFMGAAIIMPIGMTFLDAFKGD